MKTYYSILGVAKNATSDQIKDAYRKLALKHHPDRNPDDKDTTAKFQEINEANEVLSDPQKRQCYDEFGSSWKTFYKAGWSSAWGSHYHESLRGKDHYLKLTLSIFQAANGHTRTVKVAGRDVRVRIPPGVQNDNTISYSGCGGLGRNGGPNGDLHIRICIVDRRWKLIGKNVHSNEPVDLFIALLGGKILVETIDGPVKIKINPQTPNGTIIRISEKGFQSYDNKGPRGDHVLTLHVVIPCDLDSNEKKILRKLAADRKKTKTA